jgi:hypothetical protein
MAVKAAMADSPPPTHPPDEAESELHTGEPLSPSPDRAEPIPRGDKEIVDPQEEASLRASAKALLDTYSGSRSPESRLDDPVVAGLVSEYTRKALERLAANPEPVDEAVPPEAQQAKQEWLANALAAMKAQEE